MQISIIFLLLTNVSLLRTRISISLVSCLFASLHCTQLASTISALCSSVSSCSSCCCCNWSTNSCSFSSNSCKRDVRSWYSAIYIGGGSWKLANFALSASIFSRVINMTDCIFLNSSDNGSAISSLSSQDDIFSVYMNANVGLLHLCKLFSSALNWFCNCDPIFFPSTAIPPHTFYTHCDYNGNYDNDDTQRHNDTILMMVMMVLKPQRVAEPKKKCTAIRTMTLLCGERRNKRQHMRRRTHTEKRGRESEWERLGQRWCTQKKNDVLCM